MPRVILSFPMASGAHGRWSVYSTVLSLKDLVTLCTMNIAEPEGKVWKDAFYTGGPAGQAMNRAVTPSRTSALVEYVNERLLTSGAAPGVRSLSFTYSTRALVLLGVTARFIA